MLDKNTKMIIDLREWVTQQALADELGVGVNTVNNWVLRKKIKSMRIPNSTLILVNKNTISVNPNHHKVKDRGKSSNTPIWLLEKQEKIKQVASTFLSE